MSNLREKPANLHVTICVILLANLNRQTIITLLTALQKQTDN